MVDGQRESFGPCPLTAATVVSRYTALACAELRLAFFFSSAWLRRSVRLENVGREARLMSPVPVGLKAEKRRAAMMSFSEWNRTRGGNRRDGSPRGSDVGACSCV
ncbi:hypothetical protein ISCGN_007143 [Ixodes scapularis]